MLFMMQSVLLEGNKQLRNEEFCKYSPLIFPQFFIPFNVFIKIYD